LFDLRRKYFYIFLKKIDTFWIKNGNSFYCCIQASFINNVQQTIIVGGTDQLLPKYCYPTGRTPTPNRGLEKNHYLFAQKDADFRTGFQAFYLFLDGGQLSAPPDDLAHLPKGAHAAPETIRLGSVPCRIPECRWTSWSGGPGALGQAGVL